MNFQEYQQKARGFAIYPGKGTAYGFAYTALGLNGESGEVAEHAKKILRDDSGKTSPERKNHLKKELGDVLWYISNCCSELGLSLNEIAELNVEKLSSRKKRGMIKGQGSHR